MRWGRLTVAAVAVLAFGSAGIAGAAVPSLRQFHVVMPEGFTRAQMVQRLVRVTRIADRELATARVTLTGTAYSRASTSAVVPCFGKGAQKSLEGFLFPSTYAFDVRTLGSNSSPIRSRRSARTGRSSTWRTRGRRI